MNRVDLEREARFLEQVELYRQEYRSIRTAAVGEERARRHANGEVYFGGEWLPRSEIAKIVGGFQRHELLSFCEIVIWVIVLLLAAWGLCLAFAFLLFPG